ncbi:unnamed protein product, partial [Brenthis ino]
MPKNYRSRGEIMENLFIIFDPSFLSYVWPKIKNGVHLNIGHYCWDDVSVFLKDLSEGRAWAYRAADASGRYQSGLFDGKRFWLGSKEQCLLLDQNYMSKDVNETWGEFYSGDYLNTLFRKEREFGGNIDDWHSLLRRDDLMRRVVSADNDAPISLAYTVLQITLNITKFTMPKSYEITLGLCLPRSCTGEDVVSIINFSIMLNDNLRTNRTVSRSIKLNSLRHVEKTYNIKNDIAAVSLILITLTLVIVAIIATIVDLDLIKFKRYSKSISFDLEQYTDKSEKNIKPIEPKHTKLDDTIDFNEFKKVITKKVQPPVITLDVKPMEAKSCVRCGKYKKQCANPLQIDVPCPRAKYNSSSSLTTEFKRKNNIYKSLLLSFSLKHSWLRIFNTSMANKDLAMVHVLKIFAVLWIIFVHVAVLVSDLSGKIKIYLFCFNQLVQRRNLSSKFYALSYIWSGLFSAQHFFYLKSGDSTEELASKGGVFGQALQLICFIINRAIRLLPPYAYAILLTSTLSRVSRDTAALAPPGRAAACAARWWRNLLYVTDLYPKDEQCMQISWYLSCETKLHMVGAFLCLLLAAGRRRLPAALGLVLVLASSVYDVITAYTDFGYRVPDAFALYSVLINRGWSRVTPYLTGVFAGWLLHAMDGECSVSKLTSRCLWGASALALCASLALRAGAGVGAGAAVAGAQLAWPLALLWPVVACATRYSGSTRVLLCSPAVAGASRVCYGALLGAGAARAALLAADAALCGRAFCLLCYFAGSVILTLLVALGISLLIEMPCCCLLRRLSDYTHR